TSLRLAVMVWPLKETAQPLTVPLCGAGGARPLGNVSLTVTVPAVVPAPTLFTVIVYVSAASPCLKFPVWVLLRVRSATWVMVVGSLALSLAALTSPPPATLAVLVTLAGALLATLTVRVSAG